MAVRGDDSMSNSHIVRMPDLSKLNIPEKQRMIRVRDEQIFRELKTQHRRIEDQTDGAQKGDYVLIDVVRPNGEAKTIHVELGGKAFSNYQTVLLGCKAGQVLPLTTGGEKVTLRIRTVRRVEELSLTDKTIAALKIPGIITLSDYRRRYIQQHGEEIADRVFRAVQIKLINEALALAEIEVDPGELEHYNRQQRIMLQNISGDVDERIMRAYGADGTRTLEESYRRFDADNRRNFVTYLWGKALAEQAHAAPTEEERSQAMMFYCLAFDTTEEDVKRQGLQEESIRSFYRQYGIGYLREYYKSLVNFLADGIPAQPLSP